MCKIVGMIKSLTYPKIPELDEGIKFACSGCGACCRRVYRLEGFPLELREDGSCSKLSEVDERGGRRCTIYESRPEICRVEEGYRNPEYNNGVTNPALVTDPGRAQVEFYKMNNRICNQFQEEDGMGLEWRVDLGVYDV